MKASTSFNETLLDTVNMTSKN